MNPTPSYLAACAAYWLRYQKRCELVVTEFGDFSIHRSDVCGVTYDRFLCEIEVKVTFSDFKNDFKKRKWNSYEHRILTPPSYMWYLVPPALVSKVEPLIKDEHGLLTTGEGFWRGQVCDLKSIKQARRNPNGKKLSLTQIVRIVNRQSNMLISLLSSVEKMKMEMEDNRECNTPVIGQDAILP